TESGSAAKCWQTSRRSSAQKMTGCSVLQILRRLQDTARIICGGCIDREYFRGNVEADGFFSGRLTFPESQSLSERNRRVVMTPSPMRNVSWRNWHGLRNRVGSVARTRKPPRRRDVGAKRESVGEGFQCESTRLERPPDEHRCGIRPPRLADTQSL